MNPFTHNNFRHCCVRFWWPTFLETAVYIPAEHEYLPDSSLWLSLKTMYHGSPARESLAGELMEMTADIFDSCDGVSCCSVPHS